MKFRLISTDKYGKKEQIDIEDKKDIEDRKIFLDRRTKEHKEKSVPNMFFCSSVYT